VATGSYDERARLWNARMLRAPLCEHECGGGVWRLKWHPQRRGVLLAACMHAGFAVLRVPGLEQSNGGSAAGEGGAEDACSAGNRGSAEGAGGAGTGDNAEVIALSALTLEVTARYEEHGMGAALGYGADWAHRPTAKWPSSTLLGATASFYDRQLHLWKYEH
jgi:hypothetical protein